MGKKWIVVAVGCAALLVFIALYFVHPLAPLLLLASLLVQFPFIYLSLKAGFGKSYRQRAQKRYEEFLKTGDAAAWFLAEQREAAAKEVRHWSRAGRSLLAFNLARAAFAAGQTEEMLAALGRVEPAALPPEERRQYGLFMEKIVSPEKGAPGGA